VFNKNNIYISLIFLISIFNVSHTTITRRKSRRIKTRVYKALGKRWALYIEKLEGPDRIIFFRTLKSHQYSPENKPVITVDSTVQEMATYYADNIISLPMEKYRMLVQACFPNSKRKSKYTSFFYYKREPGTTNYRFFCPYCDAERSRGNVLCDHIKKEHPEHYDEVERRKREEEPPRKRRKRRKKTMIIPSRARTRSQRKRLKDIENGTI